MQIMLYVSHGIEFLCVFVENANWNAAEGWLSVWMCAWRFNRKLFIVCERVKVHKGKENENG